jgi:hypothetical protein
MRGGSLEPPRDGNHRFTMPLVVLAILTPAAAVGGLVTLFYAAFRRP